MERTFPLVLIVLFPLLAGWLATWMGAPVERLVGRVRGRALLHYAGLFALAMAGLFTVQVFDQALLPLQGSFVTWGLPPLLVEDRVELDLQLVADPLSAAVIAVLVALPLVSALRGASDPEGPDPRIGGGILVVVAVGLAVVLARSLSLLVGSVALLGPVAGLALERAGRARGTERAVGPGPFDLFVALAFAAVLLTTLSVLPRPNLDFVRIAAAGAEDSLLRVQTLLGLPTSEVLGLALVLLTAVRMGLSPFVERRARAFAAAPVAAAIIWGVVLPLVSVYLLVRLNAPLALAPWSLAALTVLGIVAALAGALRALATDDEGARLAHLSSSHAGIAVAAVGMGAWSAGLLLVAGTGAALVAQAHILESLAGPEGSLGRARLAGRGRELNRLRPLALASALALAAAPPFASFAAGAEAITGVLSRLSLLSLVINGVGLVVLIAALAIGARASIESWRSAFTDGSDPEAAGPGSAEVDENDVVIAVALALASALVLAGFGLPGVGGAEGWLAGWIAGLTATSSSFGGDLAIGTLAALGRDGTLVPAVRWGVWVAVALATLIPLRAGARLQRSAVAPLVERIELARATVVGGLRTLGEALAHLVADAGEGVVLGEVLDQAAEIDREVAGRISRGMTRSALVERLGLGLTVVVLLAWIYAKPRIATFGPDGIYGFGGLAPALQKASDPSRRRTARPAESAPIEVDPASGEVVLPGPRGLEDEDPVTFEPGEGSR